MFPAPAFFLLFALTLASASKVTLTKFEVPSSVQVDENVTIHCEYSLEEAEGRNFYIKLWVTPLFGSEAGVKKLLYQRLGDMIWHEHRVALLGKDTIQMTMHTNESGSYECEVFNDDEDKNKTDLIVYTPGTGPLLVVSTEVNETTGEEAVAVSCRADGVAPEPELVISINGVNQDTNAAKAVELTDPLLGEYSVETNVTVTDVDTPFDVRCELFYIDSDFSHNEFAEKMTYMGAGVPTSAAVEEIATTTEQWDNTTAPPNGSAALRWSWLALLAVSALAQTLPHGL